MADSTKVNPRDDVHDQAPNFGLGRECVKPEDEVLELGPFDAIRVPKETMRAFEGGRDGAEPIAIGAPSTGPGDAEMVDGRWGD